MHDDYRKRLLDRWKTIEGQVRAVRVTIEDDRYCLAIVKQTPAAQGTSDADHPRTRV